MPQGKRKSDLNWCEKDYKHRHYWERVGVAESCVSSIFVYYFCTQCHKWKRKIVEFVMGGR